MDNFTGIVLAVIGCVAAIIIILVATFRTVLDILLSFHFVPPKIHKFFLQFRKQEVLQVLDEIGLTAFRPQIRAFSNGLTFQKTEFISIEAAYRDIDECIEKSIEQGDFIFGSEKIKSKYMIDLRKFIMDTHLEKIAVAFASYIYRVCSTEKISYDIIVSPATSTLILSYYVSQLLGKPLFAFDQSTKTQKNGKDLFLVGADMNIDTERNTAIIIDESVVGGRLLSQVWQALKIIPLINCDHVFAIFHRKEGDIKRFDDLSKGAKFHFMRELSEADIEAVIKKT